MQVGAVTVVLPLLSIAVPVVLSASMQGLPPAATLPAVADAWITGGVDMNSELNGSRCWTLRVTATWFVTYAEFAG